MDVEFFLNSLDLDNNNYLYHIAPTGRGEMVIEDGLLIEGTNILDAKDIIATTTLPLEIEDLQNMEAFIEDELTSTQDRDKSEMIIIGYPKEIDSITERYEDYVDGKYYEGIVNSVYIMGYFSKNDKCFTPNEYFDYGNDYFYENMGTKRTY